MHDISATAMVFHVVYPNGLVIMFIAVKLMSCLIKVSRSLPRWIGSDVHSINIDAMSFQSLRQCYCIEHESQSILVKLRESLIGHDVSVTAMNMRATCSLQ
jgi:hypothetical protein